MEFSMRMYEDAEGLNAESAARVEQSLEFARKLDEKGHLLDGFALCSDYCFNVNPFFSPDNFDEFIVPLSEGGHHGIPEDGILYDQAYGREHHAHREADGGLRPGCHPLAGPPGGVSIPEVRKIIGNDIALVGNVNCGLLQTGTEEECRQDVLRALREGMANGRGYIFSTSNCVYTGLPLERYEMMMDLWKKYGNYDHYEENFGEKQYQHK